MQGLSMQSFISYLIEVLSDGDQIIKYRRSHSKYATKFARTRHFDKINRPEMYVLEAKIAKSKHVNTQI